MTSATPSQLPPWLPDQGDGTYRNPVLYADYSDPDAIRVGDDYWLTASSFSHVPGLPILHSRDLVNWRIVNHALPQLVPVDHFSTPRHGQGVWAPALRFHQDKFWIYYPDPDFGIYVITADHPTSTWSEPQLVKAGKGLIDPCPFWDSDGSVYLVHAWAKSRSGIKNRLTLHRLSADGRTVTDDGVVVIDGDQMPGWNTIEGPKIYQRNGYYYIFAPAGGVTDGYQAVFRSRSLYGPYENRIVLARGASAVNGPHQGAWVETPAGEHWFLHFQEQPAYGRIVHLQPMSWVDDWPRMGHPVDAAGTGEPVPSWSKPNTTVDRPEAPATSDAFNHPALGRQWQWQANPSRTWHSLTARAQWLRLYSIPQPSPTSLWAAPNLLLQKFPAPEFTTEITLEPALEIGGAAGLMVFGYSYAWLGVTRDAAGLRLVLRCNHDAHQGGAESEAFSRPVSVNALTLRVTVRRGAHCSFAWTDRAGKIETIPTAFAARSSFWVGAKIGPFATTTAATPAGHADFSQFRVLPL